jgi:hypothetical protein
VQILRVFKPHHHGSPSENRPRKVVAIPQSPPCNLTTAAGQLSKESPILEMADKVVGGMVAVKGGGGNRSEAEAGSEDSDVVEVKDAAPPMKRIRATQADAAASGSKLKGGMEGFVRAGRKALQDRADHALLVFVTCCGIPPKVADAREFKAFVSALCTDYVPPSETTLRDKLIPDEAANIHRTVINYLRGCRDLTITFDGGKLRRSKGLYSVHVTTAER